MSTRSYVAIKENGKYRYIYNHHDSYIDWLGIVLFKHYKDAEKVRALIDLGNTSFIGVSIENDAESYEEHFNRSKDKIGTVSYVRESHRWKDFLNGRKEDFKEHVASETNNVSDLFENDYAYIFDVDENKWYMAYWNDEYELRDLGKVLHSKKLLEKLFADSYIDSYLPEFYKKCLSA